MSCPGQSRARSSERRTIQFARSLAVLLVLAASDARSAADCTIATTGVAFGNYDPLDTTSTDATGNLTVTCTHVSGGATRVTYSVALSAGSSSNYTQRWMRSGTSILNYNLFDSAARTRVWGNGTGGTTRVAGSLLVNPGGNRIREASHPIYGRIPAMQSVATGNYTDTIVVTLTF